MTIAQLSWQAQLAQAAYANLRDSSNTVIANDADVSNALQADAGFSEAQAAAFVSRWKVIDHLPDTVSGFSAGLFERRDASGAGTGQFNLTIRGSTDAGWIKRARLAFLQTELPQNEYANLFSHVTTSSAVIEAIA